MQMKFITRYFSHYEQKALKIMLAALLQVLFICTPVLAVAQLPTVNLSAADEVVSEAGPDPGSFTVTRSDGGNIAEALPVKVRVTGNATLDKDYPNPDMVWFGSNLYQLTIQPEQATKTIIITPVQDGINEADETVIFTLESQNTYIIGTDKVAQLTIADDAPVVTLSVADGDVSEAGPDPGSFTVTRSDGGIFAEALPVWVRISGTAKFDQDYSNPGMIWKGSNVYELTIQPEQSTATIIITPIQDGINETDETVIFTLEGKNTYIIGTDSVAQLTIADDAPVVTLSVKDEVASESGPNPGSFIVTRSDGGIFADPLPVLVMISGTAKFDQDYSNPGMIWKGSNVYELTIQPGQFTATIIITPIQDGIIETDETVIFTLEGQNTYRVGEPVSASISIADFVEGIFKDSFESP